MWEVILVFLFRISVPPGEPLIIKLVPDILSITATWNKSRVNGGSPILDYNIALLDANNNVQRNHSGIREMCYTFRNLRQNRTYMIVLQARNVVGYGGSTNVTVSTLEAGKMLFCCLVGSAVHQLGICYSLAWYLAHLTSQSFTHSFTHSFIHSFIHLLSHLLAIYSFIHSFIHPSIPT